MNERHMQGSSPRRAAFRQAIFVELYDANVFISAGSVKGILYAFDPDPTFEISGKEVARLLNYLGITYREIDPINGEGGVLTSDSFQVRRCMAPYMHERLPAVVSRIDVRADPYLLTLRVYVDDDGVQTMHEHTYCGRYAVTWK